MIDEILNNYSLKLILLIILLIVILYCIVLKCKDNNISINKIKGGKGNDLKVELDNVINDEKEVEEVVNKINDLNKKIMKDDKNLKKKEVNFQNILQNNDKSIKIDNKYEINKLLNNSEIKIEDFSDYKDEDIELWNIEMDKYMPSNKELNEWEELFEKTVTIKDDTQKGGRNNIEIPELDDIDKELTDKINSVEKYLNQT